MMLTTPRQLFCPGDLGPWRGSVFVANNMGVLIDVHRFQTLSRLKRRYVFQYFLFAFSLNSKWFLVLHFPTRVFFLLKVDGIRISLHREVKKTLLQIVLEKKALLRRSWHELCVCYHVRVALWLISLGIWGCRCQNSRPTPFGDAMRCKKFWVSPSVRRVQAICAMIKGLDANEFII